MDLVPLIDLIGEPQPFVLTDFPIQERHQSRTKIRLQDVVQEFEGIILHGVITGLKTDQGAQ